MLTDEKIMQLFLTPLLPSVFSSTARFLMGLVCLQMVCLTLLYTKNSSTLLWTRADLSIGVSFFQATSCLHVLKNTFFLFIRPSDIFWPNVLIIGKLVFVFQTSFSFSSSVTLVKANDLHKRNCSFCFVYWDVDFFWTKRVEWCPSACNRESIS